MSFTATIQVKVVGVDTGPFNLYSDADNYFSPFETGISRTSVLNGYTSTLVPDAATVVRVQSAGKCDNFIDIKVSN